MAQTQHKPPVKKKPVSKPNMNERKKVAQRRSSARQTKAIIIFGIAALLFAVAVFKGNGLWEYLRIGIFGIFGFCAFICPLFLAYVGFSISKDRGGLGIAPKIIQVSILSILISTSIFVFSFDGYQGLWDNIVYAFDAYRVDGSVFGPGAIGASFGGLIMLLTGYCKAPAVAVVCILIIITLLILLNITLNSIADKASVPIKKIKEHKQKISNERDVVPACSQTKKPNDTNSNGIQFPISENNLPQPIQSEEQLKSEKKALKNDNDKALAALVERASNPPTLKDIKNKHKKNSPVVSDVIKDTNDGNVEDIENSNIIDNNKNAELQKQNCGYIMPPISCLADAKIKDSAGSDEEMKDSAKKLVNALNSFGVDTTITNICRGPSVTRYELQPAIGVKISRITNLSDDIALNLAASSIRIEAPIPGKAAVGIEVPNKIRDSVVMKELVGTDDYYKAKTKLNIALGKDIAGNNVFVDLSKMPHLLVAGTTGSGKSVCLNTMIMSILYNAKPDEVKLMLIDPKKVEFLKYSKVPHLLIPVVDNPNKASGALKWAVTEMLKRYQIFADNNVRDIDGYNSICEGIEASPMPRIVIFIDELADLMLSAPTEVEDSICRLAQMARAAGMHLVVATQRPSTDVITGLIKSNIPSRIALSVSSSINSRIIIDTTGAEKLLGNGDMLYYPVGMSKPLRVQGCYVSDKEIERVVDFISDETGPTEINTDITKEIDILATQQGKNSSQLINGTSSDNDDKDSMFSEAVRVVAEAQQASTTLIQRKLKVGYARAARIIDELEEDHIIGPYEGSKPRKVLISLQQYMNSQNLSNSE